MNLLFNSDSKKLKMSNRGLMLCTVLFSVSLINCLHSEGKNEKFVSNTTQNALQISWMMMPNDDERVRSEVVNDEVPTRKLSVHPIRFLLWNRKNKDRPEQVTFDKKSVSFKKFNSSLNTVILIHGFADSAKKSVFFNFLKNAFLEQGDYNVIGVNWINFASILWYGQAVKNSVFAGRITGKLIMSLRSNESKDYPVKVLVVAHNIGTLVAGVAAGVIKERKIEKIVGLDPPHVLNRILSKDRTLDKEDAQVVEIIHTSLIHIGIDESVGHRDFYPNGGKRPQPGCGFDITDKCSTRRALLYYGEAVTSKGSFMATQCESYSEYLDNYCQNNPNISLFNEEPATLTGDFFLSTNSKEPFLSY